MSDKIIFTGGRSIISVNSNKPNVSFKKIKEEIGEMENEYLEINIIAKISMEDYLNVVSIKDDTDTTIIEDIPNLIIADVQNNGNNEYFLGLKDYKFTLAYDAKTSKADFNVAFTSENDVIKTDHGAGPKTDHPIMPSFNG